MSELEIKTEAQPETADLQEQLESLRSLIVRVMLLVVVVSGTINVYLLRQVKYARADLAGFRPGASQMIADYSKATQPRMNEIAVKIAEYGRTHPAFGPIVTKYRLNSSPAAPAAAPPPSAPAPK